MHPLLHALREGVPLSGDPRADMAALLRHRGCVRTVEHSLQVAEEARRLAPCYGVEVSLVEMAAWLHDISAVIPSSRRLEAARQLGLEVLPEEAAVPMILHQKLSVVIAEELLGVCRPEVLSAIGCHTTLKADATPSDKVVFIADKIAWDQAGKPPYLADVRVGLEHSLDAGVLAYLAYLWQRRETLPVVHPWLAEAYRQLAAA